MENLTEELRIDPRKIYKNKALDAKKKLDKFVGWRKAFFAENTRYLTQRGFQLLENVVSGRSADVRLTEILEKLAIDLEAGKVTIPKS